MMVPLPPTAQTSFGPLPQTPVSVPPLPPEAPLGTLLQTVPFQRTVVRELWPDLRLAPLCVPLVKSPSYGNPGTLSRTLWMAKVDMSLPILAAVT